MNHYTVIGFATKKIDEAAKKLRVEFGEDMSEVVDQPDHVILKNSPQFAVKRTFYLNDGVTEQELFKALEGFTFKPFTLSANHLGRFPKTEYGNIVFAEIDVTPELRAVHEDLVNRVAPLSRNKFPQYEREGYRAHISLCYELPDDKVDSFERAAKKLLPFNFEVTKLSLFRKYNIEKDEVELLREFSAS